MDKKLTDWRGTEIEVGDTILYAVKHSTSVEVNEAIVSEVGEREEAWSISGDMHPYLTVEWSRSNAMHNWRKIKRLTINNVKGVTVIAKASKRVDG